MDETKRESEYYEFINKVYTEYFPQIFELRNQLTDDIKISLDEWNAWYAWYRPGSVTEGIFAASFMHMLFNQADKYGIFLACHFESVNEGAINVYKDGVEITNLPASKRNMGIVFQNYALFENMTVLGNVEYALKFRPELKENARQIALEQLENVGLTEHINKKPHMLSGGQQQRVAIARTLALRPDVILFDEPMSALDVATRLSLRQELKNIQKKLGTTMIYITHDQEEAFAMSDHIMVMDNAVIHQHDTPENIVNHPADEYIENFVLHNLKLKIDSLAKYAGGQK
jgi:ABC-type Fe3+/spermidine/putrescine transport system ATPase subunit